MLNENRLFVQYDSSLSVTTGDNPSTRAFAAYSISDSHQWIYVEGNASLMAVSGQKAFDRTAHIENNTKNDNVIMINSEPTAVGASAWNKTDDSIYSSKYVMIKKADDTDLAAYKAEKIEIINAVKASNYRSDKAADVERAKKNAVNLISAAISTEKVDDAVAAFWAEMENYKNVTPSSGPSVDAVQQVVDKINALPKPEDVTVNDEAKIKDAHDAYDKLTEEQKKDPKLTQALLSKLVDCENQLEAAKKAEEEKKAAAEVSAAIAKIPENLSTTDKATIMGICASYEVLTTGQSLVSDADYIKLYEAKMYFDKKDAKTKKVKLTKVTAKKARKATAKWKKGKSVSGYQLYYKAKDVKAKKANTTAAKKTVKKLKAGKKYSFKVRPFTYVGQPTAENGERGFKSVAVYGKWSNVKKIKAKK